MADDSPGEGRKKKVRRKNDQGDQVEELTAGGHRALLDGRMDDALKFFNKALKAAGQDPRVQSVCFCNLGAACVEAGRPRRALALLRRLPRAARLPDLQFNTALAHNALGQHRQAAAHFLQAAQLYSSQGDTHSEGDACMETGHCYTHTQEDSLAVQSFLRAAEAYRVAAILDSAAVALQEAGSVMSQSDQFSHDDISSVLTECLSLTDSITEPRILGELYLSVGVSYCRLRCFQEAVRCFQQAVGPSARRPPLLARVLLNLGAALNSMGRYTPAVGYHRLAAGLHGSLGCRGDQARCFSNLAFACSQLGDEEEAAESLLHALQGFRDTGDHLAQVQVCESLAECYLKQRKQQKAVQILKQALSALAHCQDTCGSVGDRLVERLTAALQLSVTSAPQAQRPRPLPLCPSRPRPLRTPVDQQIRKSDIISTASNQPLDLQKGEERGSEATGRQEAAGGGATAGPEYLSAAPGLDSSDQPDQQQHSELWSDRENPPSDSEASLVHESEAPPTKTRETTPTVSRWRSQFCSLM